ncbi:hypothetical protein BHE74_00002107 [Ensete ventricosum]|nr:hypothetical protein BHE74_00002107 [Ensete ventricosum]
MMQQAASGNAETRQQQWVPAMQYPPQPAMVMAPHQIVAPPIPQYAQHLVPYHHPPVLTPQHHGAGANSAAAGGEENKTIWVGDLHYWMDENYLHNCFGHTGEPSPPAGFAHGFFSPRVGRRRGREFEATYQVGDWVKFKRSVENPTYGWQGANHKSIGFVQSVLSNDSLVSKMRKCRRWRKRKRRHTRRRKRLCCSKKEKKRD